MVKLAISNFPNFEVSDIENNRSKVPSYTIDTIRELKKNNPEINFSIIIGEDSLKQLHTWYKAKELVEECRIISYPRPGQDTNLVYLEQFWAKNIAEKLFDSLVNFSMIDISSTEIRNNHYLNVYNIKKNIPEKVYDYILKNNLYQNVS